MINFKSFNESMGRKNNRHNSNIRNSNRRSWLDDKPKSNNIKIDRGMRMDFTERFEYLVRKMADKNNSIAKELLTLQNKDLKFEYSYLDLTGRDDTISYIVNADKNIPDDDKYKSNKRQISKTYKVIKTIFGSKYTKMEVSKFVSLFKQIYQNGPDEKDIIKPKLNDKQLIDKLILDTKNDKIKWKEDSKNGNFFKYSYKIKITDKKYLIFDIFYFSDIEKNSFLTINLFTNDKRSTWINTLNYSIIQDFIQIIKEKYINEK